MPRDCNREVVQSHKNRPAAGQISAAGPPIRRGYAASEIAGFVGQMPKTLTVTCSTNNLGTATWSCVIEIMKTWKSSAGSGTLVAGRESDFGWQILGGSDFRAAFFVSFLGNSTRAWGIGLFSLVLLFRD